MMNRRTNANDFPGRRVLCLCCTALLLCGCERRDITYYLESEIYIEADWNNSLLPQEEERHGATAILFTPPGEENKLVLMGSRGEESVRVPEGTYHAVIFNRSPDGFPAIRFKGDTFEEYTASAGQVETRIHPETRVATRVIICTPDELAADVLTDFTVTEEMLGNYSESSPMNRNLATTRHEPPSRYGFTRADETDPERYTLRFVPRKLTRKVYIEIHFGGINNIRSVTGTLDGISESVQLCTSQPSPPTAVQQFGLTHIAYDPGSPFNGVLSGEFNVFGLNMEMVHTLNLDILLVDNQTRIKQTLQGMAQEVPNENGELVILFKVVSPDTLPNVKPEGDPESGFDADVSDWGEPEEVPLN